MAGQPQAVATWLSVEKLTTPKDDDGKDKTYRFGYGYFDANKNNKVDPEEKALGKEYFELGEYVMYLFRDDKRSEIK